MSEFPEFSKICLHKHLGGKGADKELDQAFDKKTTFDLIYAKKQIDEASDLKYDIVGFTNKGHFDKTNYLLLQKYASSKEINLLPGVEINLLSKNKDKSLHVTVIFSPSDKVLSLLEAKLDSISTKNRQNSCIIEDLVEIVMIDKCIIYPHGLKQKIRSAKENPEQFLELIDMLHSIPITLDDSKTFKKETLINSLKTKLSEENYNFLLNVMGVATSADRGSFSDVKDPSYIWGPATFDSLYFASIMGVKRIFFKKDIVVKGRYVKKMMISSTSEEQCSLFPTTIEFSHGLNSIIGESGSGKTLLLNLLCKKLKGTDLSMPASSQTSDYENLYLGSKVQIFDQYDNEISPGDIHVFEGENLYRTIISTYASDKNALLEKLDATPKFGGFNRIISAFNQKITDFIGHLTNISNWKNDIDACYKQIISSEDYLKNNTINSDSIQFVLTNSRNTELNSLCEKKETIKSDLDSFDTNIQFIDKLISRYCSGNVLSAMKNYTMYSSLLKLSIKKKLYETEDEILKKEQIIANEDKINQFVNEYNISGGQVLIQLGKARSTIENKINQIISDFEKVALESLEVSEPTLSKKDLTESIKVGADNEDVKLSDLIFKNDITYEELPGFFEDFIGSASNKIKKSLFKSAFTKNPKIDIFNFETYKEFFSIIISSNIFLGSFFNPSIEEFITYNIEIRNGSNFVNINTLSAGQLSKIYIGKLIDKGLDATGQGSIVLYDQPDNNLEKPFILETLGDWISRTKLIHQVFITTHEPLLVVNADSNQIIRSKNSKTIGSSAKISFHTLNFINESTEEKAVKKIADLIDGSAEAIELRDDIYRGMENGNR